MKECPFLNECGDTVSESNFKAFCRVRFGFLFGYKNCSTYQRKMRGKQLKPYLQTPRDWKKETTKE